MRLKANQVESWEAISPRFWKEANRASQDALCACGLPLYRHGQPLKETCPTIIQDCIGNWWKT